MWKLLIEGLGKECRFAHRADTSDIAQAESKLNLKLPDCLKSCLLETDGVLGEYDLGLVWPLDTIIATNIQFRESVDFSELYMPFNSMLFFADAGNGDQFFFPLQGNKVRRDDVFVWSHECDSRSWVAPSMQKYIEWWIDGKISV
jgi:hypothetical protein